MQGSREWQTAVTVTEQAFKEALREGIDAMGRGLNAAGISDPKQRAAIINREIGRVLFERMLASIAAFTGAAADAPELHQCAYDVLQEIADERARMLGLPIHGGQ